jgi:uncharacterized integral membrane protein
MKRVSSFLGFFLIVLAIIFALSNRHSTTLSLVGIDVVAPVYLLTLGMLFLGLFLGALIGWGSMVPHRREANRLRKDLAAVNAKLANGERESIESPLLGMSRPRLRRRFWGPQS